MKYYWLVIAVLMFSCTTDQYRLYVQFDDTLGLKVGSDVQWENGLMLSTIDELEINTSAGGGVIASFKVPEGDCLPLDTRFILDPEIMGRGARIIVRKGTADSCWEHNTEVQGQMPVLKYLDAGDSTDIARIMKLDNAIQKIEDHLTEEPDSGEVYSDELKQLQ